MRGLPSILLGAVVVGAGLLGLLALFSGRDSGELARPAGPGRLEPLARRAPDGSGDPPTSGPHARRNVTRERRAGADEVLTALEQGNVVIAYPPDDGPPGALVELRKTVSGPFDPELAAAGQMVVLVPWEGVGGIQALAYRRRLRASGPDDPRLRAFAEAWLGKGRGNTG